MTDADRRPALERLLAWGLFLTVVLIWGTTWYAIRFQLNGTPPSVGVALRFMLAALIFWAYLLVTRRRLSLTREDWPALVPYGLAFFCFNYLLIYFGTRTVPSGLVSVLFSSVILFSLAWETVLLRTFPGWRAVLAVVLGMGGLALLFLREIEVAAVDASGAALVVGSAAVAATGNSLSAVLMKRGHSIVELLAVGMSIGSLATFGYALLSGDLARLVLDPSFLLALLYLAVIGSVVSFALYFRLVRLLGPTRAAYVTLFSPLVALGISALFESYTLSLAGAVGVVMLIGGAALAIHRKH